MKQQPKKTALKNRPAQSGFELPSKRVRVSAGIGAASILLFRWLASFHPNERLWGLNYTAFLPDLTALALFAAGLVMSTPLLYAAFVRLGRFLCGDDTAKPSPVTPLILALLGGALFWSFRMFTYFFGDGAVYLAEQYRFINGLATSPDVLFSIRSAPLTGTLLAYSAKAFQALSILKTQGILFTFWAYGAMCGVVYVYSIWNIAIDFFEKGTERLGAFLLLLFFPAVIFFFGYVEYYTFFFLFLTLYFYYGIRALEGRSRASIAGLILLLTIGFHLMALVAVPSFLFILLKRSPSARLQSLLTKRNVFLSIALVLLGFIVYYFASGVYAHGSRIIQPLYAIGDRGTFQTYTLLSSYRLLDIVNYLFLLAAPLAIGLAVFRRRGAFDEPAVLFSAINLCYFSFLLFFGFSCFGLARDWDVNTGVGMSIMFLVFSLARIHEPSPRRGYIFYAMAGLACTGGIAWFVVNSNEAASVARFTSVMALDDKHVEGDYALNGYEHLRKYFHSVRDYRNVMWAMQKKIECSHYTRDYVSYSWMLHKNIRPEKRKPYYDWVFQNLFALMDSLRRSPHDPSSVMRLQECHEYAAELILDAYYLVEKPGYAVGYAQQCFAGLHAVLPESAIDAFIEEEINFDRSSRTAGLEVFSAAAKEARFNTTLMTYIGRGFLRMQRFDSASAIFERALALNEGFKTPLVYLAASEINRTPPNIARAKEVLEKYLSETPSAGAEGNAPQEGELVQYAKTLLDEIHRQHAP